MKPRYVLAIDLGTSGPKILLISEDLEEAASGFEPNSVQLYDGGGAEQDPQEWWDSISRGIKKVISDAEIDKNQIVGISCTGQWSGTVAVDKNGQALMPAVIWLDSRGAEPLKKVTGGFPNVEGYGLSKIMKWIRLSGGAPGHSGKDPIAHILYIKEKFPKIYEETYKFLEPKDYINYRLTGKFISTVDTMTLHWVTDNRKIDDIKYDDGLLRLSAIDRDKLPDMIKSTDIVGEISKSVADELGLSEQTVVVGGTPDVQSAAIGAGTVSDFQANLCIGTSAFLTCHVPFKKTDIFHNMASLPSGIPGKYLLMNEQESAGACINFLKEKLLFGNDALANKEITDSEVHQIFDQLASEVSAGSDGLIFTPWLYGERSPIEDHNIRGGYHNLSLKHSKGHLIRSAMEGVALNIRWLKIYVEKFISKEVDTINIIGGGAMSDLWCQIVADTLNCQINKVKNPRHANARGAAAVAFVGLGLSTFEQFAEKTVIDKVFEANVNNKSIYDKLFKEFLKIYKKNRKIHARLNQI